jgi:hypothetical protein
MMMPVNKPRPSRSDWPPIFGLPTPSILKGSIMRTLPLFILAVGVITTMASDLPDTRILTLSGQGKDDGVPWEFNCTAGRNSGMWTTIAVPSSWECQGFGAFGYQDDPKPCEQGHYRRTFSVPAAWQGQSIRLVFEGVQTDTTVRINGQSAGDKHIGGFYRFTYDVTALVKTGAENRIEVDVDKRSSDESVNKAERAGDYWNFSGIFRPVYLECDPPLHLRRVAIDAKADGTFAMDVVSGGTGRADRIEAVIQTLDGKWVGSPFTAALTPEGTARLTTTVTKPRLWTAETPNLYQVETRLMSGSTVLHRKIQRFGFRTIELRAGDGVYVNGQRIILQGACRHSFWPDSGRCTSVAISRLDITLMKEMNANAVRMSHYPPDQHFLDLCDEMGLYVLDELGGWHGHYDTPIGKTLVGEMVVRDVNHPSIVMWDNGNEGGFNTALDDEFAKWDPQHRQVVHPSDPLGKLTTTHYPHYADLLKFASDKKFLYMPTEFLHALYDGGAGAGMQDYWPVLRGPNCAGGFVWAWLDECVKRPDKDGKLDGDGNHAPDGILGPYREKEASYFTLKRIWSPVQIALAQLPKDFSGDLPVENQFAFTNLSQCTFSWELRVLSSLTSAKPGHVVIAKGDIVAPAIAPGASGRLHVSLPKDRKHAEVLAVTARDPAGRELWTWTWPLETMPVVRAVNGASAALQESSMDLALSTGDLTVRIDRATGKLAEVRRGNQVFPLTNGPRSTVGNSTLTKITHRVENGAQVIEAIYTGELVSTRWRLGGDGWLHLEYTYRHEGPVSQLGVGFDLPDNAVTGMRWCGQGPYRVYQNRLLGGTFDVWDLEANGTMTGYSGWKYPETKGYYADVRWLILRTPAGQIIIRPGESGRFVQVLKPKSPDDSWGGSAADFSSTGLAFLDAIAPIGNKFHKAKDTGPQGQPTMASGEYHGSADFWFGPGAH